MNKSAVYQGIREAGVMPTTFVYDTPETVKLAGTLYENGIHVIEILQRTSGAIDAVKAVKEQIPNMLVGAGTVLTVEMAEAAASAGADYIVTPFYSQEVVDWCNRREMAVIPGCGTITEVSRGYQSGLRCFKYFPAKQLGGPEAIRQISEIYSDARYIVTGGMDYGDLLEFSPIKYVAAVGTVCMMPRELMEAHSWDEIGERTRKAVASSLGLELAYVSDGSLSPVVMVLTDMLRIYSHERHQVPEIPQRIRSLGGPHTACFYTNSLERAMAFFRRYEPEWEVLLREDDGSPVVADLQLPIPGGRIRLVSRYYIYKT